MDLEIIGVFALAGGTGRGIAGLVLAGSSIVARTEAEADGEYNPETRRDIDWQGA